MDNKCFAACCFLICLGLVQVTSSRAEVIFYESFETPALKYDVDSYQVSPGSSIGVGSELGAGWREMDRVIILRRNTSWLFPDGVQALELQGSTACPTPVLDIGQSYRVSFFMAADPTPYYADAAETVRLSLEGSVFYGETVLGYYTVQAPPRGSSTPVWTHFSVDFTLTAPQGLVFGSSTYEFDGHGPLIDGITVETIPEPSIVALMSAGLVGVLLRRRKI